MSDDHAFITRLDGGTGTRVAVKDLLDMAGTVTTAGCREVERTAVAATADARCLRGFRAAEARGEVRFVGKTNMHELAFGVTGINPAYGTPVNPLDPTRCPGGSSSGSAVAVASGAADIALGSDTGGSIRIPAACCGVAGLKTSWGRIPVDGCWPLSPFLDTIGPISGSVAGLVTAMELLEPGFAASFTRASAPMVIGRIRPAVDVDPGVDAAVDEALRSAGLDVVELDAHWWATFQDQCLTVLLAEAWAADRHLLETPDSQVGHGTRQRLLAGAEVSAEAAERGRAHREAGLGMLGELFTRVGALALPSVPVLTPTIDEAPTAPLGAFTRPGNLLGVPGLSLPVPVPSALRTASTAHLPASLQLLGSMGGEEQLLRIGTLIEAAVGGPNR